MVISNILGGLGNQMFQYAIGKAIAQRNNQLLKLDTTEFNNYELRNYELGCFKINADIASKKEIDSYKNQSFSWVNKLSQKLIRRDILANSNVIQEKHYHFDPKMIDSKGNVYLFGYWQSEKYFLDIKDTILKEFSFKNPLSESAKQYEQNILSHNAVSLHIRRGDYVNNTVTNNYHGTCTLDYYKKAANIILQNNSDAIFYIFSDDLAWAKENLSFIDTKTFVELDDNAPDHEEMLLMSQCKHNIIANSSFSWWGAWLNQNPEKIVIAPKQWFNDQSIDTSDLIPQSWIRL